MDKKIQDFRTDVEINFFLLKYWDQIIHINQQLTLEKLLKN